ncbi:hypothetical protein OG948_58600 (plasmid) [Embleya sp. NBC_00888]|uniref:hypothetical protein n=1 Tax=Embleya sp. NBC_00888 TaxID=2975960 RepID=UPI002F90A36B|nr:hypothetical protein OG948_58600 [Embleya sp. NBC_00888]
MTTENTPAPGDDETATAEPAEPAGGFRASARDLWHRLRTEDDGYTTETIIVTATLLAIAIAVLVILRGKIITKVNSINFGMDTVDGATHTAVSAAHTFVAHAVLAFL